jgi:phage-related baseplate assembly protein
MTIDLSSLPPPAVVETLSFEAIVAAMKADMVARLPEIAPTLALESTVVAKQMQVTSFRETLLRARINDAARAGLLAFAGGSDLDHLAALLGVRRRVVTPASDGQPAVMEDDERLRRRVQLAPEAFSSAGPAGAYVFHALTAAPTLRDASAYSTSPGSVTVALLADRDDPVPTDAEVTAVRAALSDERVRPLTDSVAVVKVVPVVVPIVATMTLFPGPDAGLVVAQAEAALRDLVDRSRRLGFDLRRSAVFGRLHVDGVHSVTLISPADDVIVGPGQCVRVPDITLTVTGRDQ